MTTQLDIQGWFERGVKDQATHMIVATDTFDYEDYPVFINDKVENLQDRIYHFQNADMSKVMEVYNLKMDMQTQLNEHRAWNN